MSMRGSCLVPTNANSIRETALSPFPPQWVRTNFLPLGGTRITRRGEDGVYQSEKRGNMVTIGSEGRSYQSKDLAVL